MEGYRNISFKITAKEYKAVKEYLDQFAHVEADKHDITCEIKTWVEGCIDKIINKGGPFA